MWKKKSYCAELKLVRQPPSLFPMLTECGFFTGSVVFSWSQSQAHNLAQPTLGRGSNLECARVQLPVCPVTLFNTTLPG